MKRHALTNLCALAATIGVAGLMMGMTQPQDRPRNEGAHDPERNSQREDNRQQRPDKQPDNRPDKKVLEIRINADALRARLNRSISRAQQMLEIHQAALIKLDKGASPTEVLAEIKLLGKAQFAPRGQRPAGSRQNDDEKNQPRHSMGPKDRMQMHKFLEKNFPELWSNLQPILKHNPENADRLLGRMSPQIREIMLLEADQPDLAKLKVQEMHAGLMFVEATRHYRAIKNKRSASGSEIAEASEVLRDAASKRFDVQLKAKQYEIAQLEARLNELKASIEQVEDHREQEIDRMLAAADKGKRKPKHAD